MCVCVCVFLFYFRLHGSYEALGGGHALEALVDLTGSIAEKMDLTPETPFELISEAIERGALITCGKKVCKIFG